MNEVKRLSLDMQYPFQYMEDENGNLVYYKDYAALQEQLTNILKSAGIEADTVQAGVMELKAQRDALVAENAEVKGIVEGHAAGFKICPQCSHQDECETDDVVWMVRNATPSTEACLNAVRAEGVDKAIEHLHNKFASTGHVGVPVMALEWLATQLRAGNAGKDGSHE